MAKYLLFGVLLITVPFLIAAQQSAELFISVQFVDALSGFAINGSVAVYDFNNGYYSGNYTNNFGFATVSWFGPDPYLVQCDGPFSGSYYYPISLNNTSGNVSLLCPLLNSANLTYPDEEINLHWTGATSLVSHFYFPSNQGPPSCIVTAGGPNCFSQGGSATSTPSSSGYYGHEATTTNCLPPGVYEYKVEAPAIGDFATSTTRVEVYTGPDGNVGTFDLSGFTTAQFVHVFNLNITIVNNYERQIDLQTVMTAIPNLDSNGIPTSTATVDTIYGISSYCSGLVSTTAAVTTWGATSTGPSVTGNGNGNAAQSFITTLRASTTAARGTTGPASTGSNTNGNANGPQVVAVTFTGDSTTAKVTSGGYYQNGNNGNGNSETTNSIGAAGGPVSAVGKFAALSLLAIVMAVFISLF